MMGQMRQVLPAVDTDVLDDVEIPLKNLEFTIEQYLLINGARLDTETRILLAGVRDCVARVASSARSMAEDDEIEASNDNDGDAVALYGNIAATV